MNVQPSDSDLNTSIADCDDDVPDPYGSYSPAMLHAHLVLAPTLLAGLSGVPRSVCQAVHEAIFHRLDDVGGFDGIVATPFVVIGPPVTDLAGATRWLADHPAPDVDAIREAAAADGLDDEAAHRWAVAALSTHSLALSTEMDTNPSLTFGSAAALAELLSADVAESTSVSDTIHVDHLTELTLVLLALTSTQCRLAGGATVVDPGAAARSRSSRSN